MLSLTYKQQEHSHWCGPAVLQMVMAFWGDSISQAELAQMLGTSEEEGTDEDDMERVVQELGYEIVEDEGTIDDIRACIQKGIPVVVAFIEPINNEGHYSVVTDVNNEEIVLSDPEIDRYPTITLPLNDFLERWKSQYTQREQWMLAFRKLEAIS